MYNIQHFSNCFFTKYTCLLPMSSSRASTRNSFGLILFVIFSIASSFVRIPISTFHRGLRSERIHAVTTDETTFTSDSAKKQIGNDAFLNKNLMSRAQNGPGMKNKEQLKIGIVGAGLAGMVAAMDLADAGHKVELFELRPYVGGKVSSWKDKDGNHIEMGLHVFFGCYYNLFGIMKRTGSFDSNLRIKEHIHTFVNEGGSLGALDFRFPIGAPVAGLAAFAATEQLGILYTLQINYIYPLFRTIPSPYMEKYV